MIDDEPKLASFVSRALTSVGYGVDVADDGRSGLNMARTGMYSLIILDLNLPTLSGEAVLSEVLAECRERQVLVLTARGDISDRVHFLELGAADYMTKPFHLSGRRDIRREWSSAMRDEPPGSAHLSSGHHTSQLASHDGSVRAGLSRANGVRSQPGSRPLAKAANVLPNQATNL